MGTYILVLEFSNDLAPGLHRTSFPFVPDEGQSLKAAERRARIYQAGLATHHFRLHRKYLQRVAQ
jgi:hypothetical protein